MVVLQSHLTVSFMALRLMAALVTMVFFLNLIQLMGYLLKNWILMVLMDPSQFMLNYCMLHRDKAKQ